MITIVTIYFLIQLSLIEQWDCIKSDAYYPHGSYIVLKRSEGVRDNLISTITLESFSCCMVVTDSRSYFFSKKTKQFISARHTYDPRKKYLKTVYHVPYNMGKYNYFTNNCKQFYYDHKNTI